MKCNFIENLEFKEVLCYEDDGEEVKFNIGESFSNINDFDDIEITSFDDEEIHFKYDRNDEDWLCFNDIYNVNSRHVSLVTKTVQTLYDYTIGSNSDSFITFGKIDEISCGLVNINGYLFDKELQDLNSDEAYFDNFETIFSTDSKELFNSIVKEYFPKMLDMSIDINEEMKKLKNTVQRLTN